MYAEKQIMTILKCRAGYGISSEEMNLSHWKIERISKGTFYKVG